MKNHTSKYSPSAIREAFYGNSQNPHKPSSRENLTLKNQLTPTAKFIIKEAKKKLGESANINSKDLLTEKELQNLVELIEQKEGEILSAKERTQVVALLSSSLDHYDILTPLVENPEVNDIIVRAYNDISIQKSRANIQTDLEFPDHDTYKAFIENLLKRSGKACTTSTPVVDVAIDPHVRACVTHQSFSPEGSGPMLTLRIARHKNISLEGLIQSELCPQVILNYLASIISEGSQTVLIAGEVGTGKTTLIKALVSKIPENEAILIIEDTHELVLERNFVRTLLTREANTEGAGKISPAKAIRTGMRMAMNRLILGEMRDAEAAEAFIDVCSSGHSGMSTIHARSARDAISRLELLLSRAQAGVGMDSIRRQIANAVSIIVYLGLDKDSGKRRVKEVVEIGTYADGAIQFSPIFSFNRDKENNNIYWKREAGVSSHYNILSKHKVFIENAGDKFFLDAEDMYRNLKH